MSQIQHYLGNPSLKAARVQITYTPHELQEYAKCSHDPIYFIENYCQIVSLDKGVVLFKMFPYQKRIVKALKENRKVVGKLFRQAGKSTIIAAYVTWLVTFHEHEYAAILANKMAIAREIFSRVQFMIEGLPFWLQQGVLEWNKTSFKLENGSNCFCAASSPSSIRGKSISFLLLDEFAHLGNELAEEFIASVFPTISSSEKARLVIISTPKGLNHFHKVWVDAEKGTNGFVPIEGFWQEHPYRTEKWAEEQKAILGEVRYNQEVLCSFIGSSASLIDGYKLASLATIEPLATHDGLKIFKKPEKNRSYVMTVDTSRGQHLDHSAFSVIDVTKAPYEVVATFKNNKTSTLAYPFIIMRVAKDYNDAYLLIEVNDMGGEVANTIWHEYEYENMFYTHKEVVNESGLGYPGVMTSKKVKTVGCFVLKDLVEKDQLILNSHDIVQEASIFVQKKASYAAEDTVINDDLMTTLWLFGWLTKQPFFADLKDINVRALLASNQEKAFEDAMLPMGFFHDGREDDVSTEEALLRAMRENQGKYSDPMDAWINS